MATGQELWQAHLARESERHNEARLCGLWWGRQRTRVTTLPDKYQPLSVHDAMVDANDSEMRSGWFKGAR